MSHARGEGGKSYTEVYQGVFQSILTHPILLIRRIGNSHNSLNAVKFTNIQEYAEYFSEVMLPRVAGGLKQSPAMWVVLLVFPLLSDTVFQQAAPQAVTQKKISKVELAENSKLNEVEDEQPIEHYIWLACFLR